MRIGPEVKMLAALGVLFFVAGVSDSLVLNKCQLKQELEAVNFTLPKGVLNETKEDLLAKIVCHVQLTSGFNTSTVKQITNSNHCNNSDERDSGNRRVRSARSGKGKPPPPPRQVKPSSSEEDSDSDEKHEKCGMKLWTLYGLFQLSDNVACTLIGGRSMNLCGLSCSKLIDDDIRDDMACTQLLINKITVVNRERQVADLINTMISLIYQTECVNVVASSYFSEC
ncbi:Alpha-lactalbumin Lactose synthase B protein [Triplophysa tibetana]|uniref:lysozyme n=1 Tax=Triplophysa tibetana TaxID=1572043 RepID=A0A5A9PJA6_9TELE|nr:Alpha-lactalbumin Lactose synthase B protein [Triplophysa tibetana]